MGIWLAFAVSINYLQTAVTIMGHGIGLVNVNTKKIYWDCGIWKAEDAKRLKIPKYAAPKPSRRSISFTKCYNLYTSSY
jgi:hypothetical protein